MKRPSRKGGLIQLAILAALLAGVLTSVWVYATTPDAASGQRTGPSRSNLAVQSGALVAGLTGGAITLWLNDQRRRHNERELDQRRQHNQAELAQDRDRVEEERFARAVELLGHNRAAVRVGALHALAGLATTAPARTQTVLDVLCAYLRQPFLHPDWDAPATSPETTTARETDGGNPDSTSVAERAELDREREVRRTAQRLIPALLPVAEEDSPELEPESELELVLSSYGVPIPPAGVEKKRIERLFTAPTCFLGTLASRLWVVPQEEVDAYDGPKLEPEPGPAAHFVDLGAAELDHMDLSGKAHALRASGAQFHGHAEFGKARFHGKAEFGGAQFYVDAGFCGARFQGKAEFGGAQFHGRAIFSSEYKLAPREFILKEDHGSVQFHATATFSDAQFYRNAEFSEASFHGDAIFDDAQFHGDANFDEVDFGYSVIDLYSSGRGGLSFTRAIFHGDLVLPPRSGAPTMSAEGATVNGRRRIELPQGWRLESPGEPISRLLPPPPETFDVE